MIKIPSTGALSPVACQFLATEVDGAYSVQDLITKAYSLHNVSGLLLGKTQLCSSDRLEMATVVSSAGYNADAHAITLTGVRSNVWWAYALAVFHLVQPAHMSFE